MLDIKKEISEQIAKTIENVEAKEIYTYIEIPKDTKNGDYSFPCFRLAKILKKAGAQNVYFLTISIGQGI